MLAAASSQIAMPCLVLLENSEDIRKDELPVAVSCSVKRSEAVITNQKAMRAFLTLAVLSCVCAAFECPSGYGGAKECLGEGKEGHCDLEMPMNVKSQGCMEPQKLETLAPKGKYWQGCGMKDAGVEDACCNCWPLARLRAKAASNPFDFTCRPCDGKCCQGFGQFLWCQLGGSRCSTECSEDC
eukprot:symbB.v1.2.030166.t1/scaffold3356.1/size58521/7